MESYGRLNHLLDMQLRTLIVIVNSSPYCTTEPTELNETCTTADRLNVSGSGRERAAGTQVVVGSRDASRIANCDVSRFDLILYLFRHLTKTPTTPLSGVGGQRGVRGRASIGIGVPGFWGEGGGSAG